MVKTTQVSGDMKNCSSFGYHGVIQRNKEHELGSPLWPIINPYVECVCCRS